MGQNGTNCRITATLTIKDVHLTTNWKWDGHVGLQVYRRGEQFGIISEESVVLDRQPADRSDLVGDIRRAVTALLMCHRLDTSIRLDCIRRRPEGACSRLQ